MSRWVDLYKQHAYRTTWESIKEAITNTTIDDESVFYEARRLGSNAQRVISIIIKTGTMPI